MLYFSPILAVDPEFFVTTPEGRVICSEKVFPMEALRPFYGETKVVPDGVQGEIQPASTTCRESVIIYIKDALNLIDSHLTLKGLKLNINTVVNVEKEEIDSGGTNCRIIGCNPSMNAYTGTLSPMPRKKEYAKHLQREAGGHLHCITPSNEFVRGDVTPLVKALDAFVGTLGVIGSASRQKEEVVRRKLFGRAGEYRKRNYPIFEHAGDELKDHIGLEYRVLSNHWLEHPLYYSLYHGVMREVFDYYRLNTEHKLKWDEAKVMEVINTSDVEGAKELWRSTLLEQYSLEVVQDSEWDYPDPMFINSFLNDVRKVGGWEVYGFNSNWRQTPRISAVYAAVVPPSEQGIG